MSRRSRGLRDVAPVQWGATLMDLGLTWFDFLAFVIVGLSAIMAFARGLIREVFTIIAFAAGILAAIAASLARQDVNLDAVLQEPGYPKDRLPFVITVEPCAEAALLEALDELSQAEWHADPPLALPMLLGQDS